MILALLLLQSQPLPPPDIQLGATVRARSLTVEKAGEARIAVTTDPKGENLIDIQAPRASGGRSIRNPTIRLQVEARIADPLEQPKPASGSVPE